MAKKNDNEIIIVNGEKMTIKAWKEMVAEKQKTRRGKKRFLKATKKKAMPKKKETTKISEMSKEIEKLITEISVLKSVEVYKHHAYRSWGTIANQILGFEEISTPMTSYCVNFNEFNKLVNEIKKIAEKNEKAVYQYVEKLAWKMEDMKQDIIAIMDAVKESGVCSQFKNHEAINGKGRQLGLGTVITKCYKAIPKIDDTIEHLKKTANEGIDILDYEKVLSFSERKRCL